MALIRAVAEAHQPLCVVANVVANFLFRARGDLDDARVGAIRQRFELQQVEGLEQHQPRDGITKVAVRLLEQQYVAIFVFLAQECQVVF